MSEITKLPMIRRLFIRFLTNPVTGSLMQKIGGVMLRRFPGQITCQQFENFLIDYLEDRLSQKQRSLFERHMKVCPMCRTSLNSYLKVIEMGQVICAEDEKDLVFTAAPQELIDAIIDVSKSNLPK